MFFSGNGLNGRHFYYRLSVDILYGRDYLSTAITYPDNLFGQVIAVDKLSCLDKL